MKFSRLNTLFAVLVCTMLPVVSYLIIRRYTDTHVIMPRKYFADRVVDSVVNGKRSIDTQWHQVRNIKMVNHFGDTVSLDDLKGKVIIVDFFFTRCRTICPALTRSMKSIQQSVLKDTGIHLISISIDPKRDSVHTLRQYALQNGIKQNNWWLCRVVDDSLEKIMYTEFKAGFKRDSVYEFDHSTNVYLLDKNRIIRGKPVPEVIEEGQPIANRFYDGTDSADMYRLMTDAGLVKMERTEKAGKPPFGLLIASTAILGAAFFTLMYFTRKKKDNFIPAHLREKQ
jgi:protein SCO1